MNEISQIKSLSLSSLLSFLGFVFLVLFLLLGVWRMSSESAVGKSVMAG